MTVVKGIKVFFNRFRGITLGTFLGFISVIVGVIALLPKFTDPRSLLLLIMGTIIVLLLYAFIFILWGNFQMSFEKLNKNFEEHKNRLNALDHIVFDYFAYSWQQNQYFNRSHHFVEEKIHLANSLVEKLLPSLIEKICRDHPHPEKIIKIILDSGTTITPVFPCLMKHGIPKGEKFSVNFYTNNLAGIDEIHRFPANDASKISERDFNLIGGKPLNQYRATTGEFTQGILKDLFDEQGKSDGRIISIGIITANWILCGKTFDRLKICARGDGHLEFKKELINRCHYLIIVSPLGKLLPMDSIAKFNAIISNTGEPYNDFEIPEKKRNQTYLHISYRKPHSVSPLARISGDLKTLEDEGSSKNYIFSEASPEFDPSNDPNQAIRMDLPHDYIELNFKKIYHYDYRDIHR